MQTIALAIAACVIALLVAGAIVMAIALLGRMTGDESRGRRDL